MKQAVNFRLEEGIVQTIAVLAKELHTNKTSIVETAIRQFAATLSKKNTLSRFAGSLDTTDADQMLTAIHADKTSKDVDLKL